MDERKNIFRKKGPASPEKLNDYIKVSNPGVWLILGAVGAVLAGFIIWGLTYELPEGIRPFHLFTDR